MRIRVRISRECDTCGERIYFDVFDADDPVTTYVQVTHLSRKRVEVTERSEGFTGRVEIVDLGLAMEYAADKVMRHTGCLEYAEPGF